MLVVSLLASLSLLAGARLQSPVTVPAPTDRAVHADSVPHAADARRELVAIAAATPPRIDGVLDDALWRSAEPATGFVQAEPNEGAPASERTEAWVAFDGATLYVAAYLHDGASLAPVVNDIRKDFQETEQDDFEVLLDTFGDRRNGYVFITNAEGAKADRQVANEGREINTSWDATWTVATHRVADGWTAEMAIPFRALRFAGGATPRWGINFSRRVRRRNEIDFWSPVPRAYTLARVSRAGDLLGLTTGGGGRDLRVKPYVAGRALRDPASPAAVRKGDAGVDLKYGVTSGLTLDVTVNPDFAQVEADEQQVNLTQFSQFFPEKREFFLENSGVFYVGDAARNNRVSLAPTPDEDLLLFFSRRIGLAPDGQPTPIPAGVRLTGTAAGVGVGALSMQTRASSTARATNYSVLRLRRNLFAGSDVGVIAMSRQATDSGRDYNRVAGADANFRLFGRVDWNSYAVRSATPGAAHGQYAARSSVNYEGRFLHFKGGALEIGDGFRDDLGYYRRTDTRKWLLDTGLRPRLAWVRAHGVREMHPHVTWNYYESPHGGRILAKNLHTGYTLFFNTGGFVELSANPRYERTAQPFRLYRSVSPLPAGGYAWNEWQLKGATDASRALSLDYTGIVGGLWSGTQRAVRSTITYRPTYRLRLAGGISRTDARQRVPRDEQFVATLYTGRASYSFTTRMFVDALTQYDPASHQLSANVRYNLIHHPLSDLFIVYNDQRFLTPDAPIAGRSLIVKFTQMVAF
jgi:Domain of unknown function (DUF5916)/Carbohydrate family 9 binding domain-like